MARAKIKSRSRAERRGTIEALEKGGRLRGDVGDFSSSQESRSVVDLTDEPESEEDAERDMLSGGRAKRFRKDTVVDLAPPETSKSAVADAPSSGDARPAPKPGRKAKLTARAVKPLVAKASSRMVQDMYPSDSAIAAATPGQRETPCPGGITRGSNLLWLESVDKQMAVDVAQGLCTRCGRKDCFKDRDGACSYDPDELAHVRCISCGRLGHLCCAPASTLPCQPAYTHVALQCKTEINVKAVKSRSYYDCREYKQIASSCGHWLVRDEHIMRKFLSPPYLHLIKYNYTKDLGMLF
ncbi:hypothetical protein H632_c30p1 [Helicosporidium sp. ATCC 50920]|nr:hypothetical protein H632_c30p1 [Helicosporidium sp. ATCC 50920]|eukprot:KDD77056.1 hypothetical protein H632_c30p1 [Helicosporidium sp. ATCC 50920]